MSIRSISLGSVLIFLVAASLCLAGLTSAFAGDVLDDFIWETVRSSGNVLALSRGDDAINFFDIGDLAPSSSSFVEHIVSSLSGAAHIGIERRPGRSSSIAIFHDSNVFRRLANDQRAFSAVGIPDDVINSLAQKLSDGAKCITMTVSDNDKNIRFTVILVSQSSQFEGCMMNGLLNSFGIATTGIEATEVTEHDLVTTCILHKGRRLGLRDRKSLSEQAASLRERCAHQS